MSAYCVRACKIKHFTKREFSGIFSLAGGILRFQNGNSRWPCPQGPKSGRAAAARPNSFRRLCTSVHRGLAIMRYINLLLTLTLTLTYVDLTSDDIHGRSGVRLHYMGDSLRPTLSHWLNAYCTVIVRVSYGYEYTRGSGRVWVEIFDAGRVRVRVASSGTGSIIGYAYGSGS